MRVIRHIPLRHSANQTDKVIMTDNVNAPVIVLADAAYGYVEYIVIVLIIYLHQKVNITMI